MLWAALLAIMLCCTALFSAQAAAKKNQLSYTLYLGDARTTTADSLKNKQKDLVAFFSPFQNYQYHFVLPGNWDCKHLRLFMTGTSSVTFNGKQYKNGDEVSLSPGKKTYLRPSKGAGINITVVKTGGLPTLFLHTNSGSSTKIHADKTYKEPGTLYMLDKEGNVEYDGALAAIRTRGNSTFKYDKKPYQIKLKKSASLCGMKKNKTYILLANTLDRSEIRNTLALDLARYSGAYAFVPAAQSVDLYLNYDYKGTYLLTEKVEIDEDRLNISNLESAMESLNPELDFSQLQAKGDAELKNGAKKYYAIPNMPKDITGGYLIQSNLETRYATEASAFVTKQGLPFTLQEPKYASKRQVDYLASLFQKIENALTSKDGVDSSSKKHYSELLDMNTLVHRYLQAEVLDDFDGQRGYFYKDSDQLDAKVYVGPVWDQDNILGASSKRCDPSVISISRDRSAPYYWMTLATKHKDFRNAAIKAYHETYAPALNILLGKSSDPSGVLRSVDEYVQEVETSAKADLIRWPIRLRNTYTNFNTNSGRNYEAQISFLKKYIQQRKKALDKAFPKPAVKGSTARATSKATAKPTPAPTAAPTVIPTTLPVISAAPTAAVTPTAVVTPAPIKASASPSAVPPASENAPAEQNASKTDAPNPKDIYFTLRKGSSHAAVYQLRLRLHQLGYLSSAGSMDRESSYVYDSKVITAIKALQKANGLKEDGVSSPDLQALIYSNQVKGPDGKAGKPTTKPTTAPKASGPSAAAIEKANLPPLDEEGFLPSESKTEFVYKSSSDGLWYYISDTLFVEIQRFTQQKPKLIWYETRVKVRGGLAPAAIFSNGKQDSVREVLPEKIAIPAKAVLAISDDYYAYRLKARNVGIIIRNGKLLHNRLDILSSLRIFPRMDVMAFLPDGGMAVYERGEITASKLQKMGVKNSYSFGPILVHHGVAHPSGRYGPTLLQTGNEPRSAIGLLDKNDYLILTVDGRYDGSTGVNTSWLVDKFLEKGAQTAFNLDGGGTTALVFMGERLNKAGKSVRGIPSMISFGTSSQVKSK